MGILYEKVIKMRENGKSFIPKKPLITEKSCTQIHQNTQKYKKEEKTSHSKAKEVSNDDNGADRKSWT